ncbi:unnamed protein product [Rotaria socialis]|uniref:BED-type domain-containing protein n=1 Tax=Rotaria socialis TaxID=392032 RepID=A0A818UYH3_9BILA|nr:unnamed protein product [Rotaria socialis]
MAGSGWRRYFEFSLTEKNRNNGLCKLCNRIYKDKYGTHSDEYARTFNIQHEFSSEGTHVAEDSPISREITNSKDRHNRITCLIGCGYLNEYILVSVVMSTHTQQ